MIQATKPLEAGGRQPRAGGLIAVHVSVWTQHQASGAQDCDRRIPTLVR